ncbi:MAG: ThuA domain-containing protein [Daejeonella sp.]
MRKIFFLLLFTSLLSNSVANKVSLLIGDSLNSAVRQQIPRRAEVLFLGSTGTLHNSSKLSPLLSLSLFKAGINITYTVDTNDLNTENLSKYDGLIIYANYNTISSAKEKALKDFVESGKGLIPLHTASSCFANSAWYIRAVGGQFKSHKKDKFTAKIVNSSHPVMRGISEFETWDDTYVHSNINPDITILQERVEGSSREPWTWVRNQGKGRVFYTAYGHNDSTWTKPGFLKLVENGVLWAVGDKVNEQFAQSDQPAVIKTAQAPVKTGPVAKIVIKVVQNVMKYDKTLISVKAGQKVMISLENPDFMQHNLVILMPGTLQKVGEAADALARDPKGAQTDYLPKIQEVLHSTKLLNPDESFTLQFTAPNKPGDYPFVCTFPGHWRIMNGIMRVTK